MIGSLREETMALMTHQLQGSYAAFSSRYVSWRTRMEPKRVFLRSTHVKSKSCLCVGAPLVHGSKRKSLTIVSFKGKNEESGGKESGSKSAKNSDDYSGVPQDSEETLPASSKVQNGQLFLMSETDKKLSGSLAIQKLFKSWLTLLHTPSPAIVVDETLEGKPLLTEISETKNVTPLKERSEILKMVWFRFQGLDATIRMPILIFFPFCMAVTVRYGPRTSIDLAPCWIGGALLFALCIQMVKLVLRFYAFTFWKIVTTITFYPMAAYNFIVSGKLKETIRVYLWQPLMEIMKWSDHKYVKARAKAWVAAKKAELEEKVTDFVEDMWPYYCRAIRTLKNAKII